MSTIKLPRIVRGAEAPTPALCSLASITGAATEVEGGFVVHREDRWAHALSACGARELT